MALPAPNKKLSAPESLYLVEVVKGMILTMSHIVKNIFDPERFRTIEYPDVRKPMASAVLRLLRT